ncbi:MAG: uncharacterized protein PWQ37_2215 [Candidatus Petromonas sp.]|jgi:DUF917 family protein|nr:uncharacterized protein [Candidatus Petromonas sp.]
MRKIDSQALEDIALGAALLGTGGGGDPYVGKLMAKQAIEEYGPVTLLSPDEVPEDALVVPSAMMGAPTVLVEKLMNGEELIRSFKGLENYLGKKIYATLPIEAGGVNSMIPFVVAARMGIPIIDADGMGRAFPELQMLTFHLGGLNATPMVLSDEKGNDIIFKTVNNYFTENSARSTVVLMGGSATLSIYPMTGKDVKEHGVTGIISFSEKIGKGIKESRKNGQNPIDVLQQITGGFELFRGKVTDVLRKTEGGFNKGQAVIDGLESYKGETLVVEFQNENLIARKGEKILATTPDLICIVNLETSIPFTTEALKYGQRVLVLGIPCDPKFRTPEGIKTVGPRYFKYDIDYVPIEDLVKGDVK